MLSRDQLRQRAHPVRFLSCDVDGVLTDGRVYIDDDGRESKAFHALDGVAMHLLADAGIVVAWITGSSAPTYPRRSRLLGVPPLVEAPSDKLAEWRSFGLDLAILTLPTNVPPEMTELFLKELAPAR